ncbi:MAG: 5'-nucleotidase [Candidatus Cloacimonadota bacterium]|nr:MAG: 5'-nucleotidase [Candidatus Cloacimonadota bacterium]
MSYCIENKLAVGISSNALFNLEEEEKIFMEEGIEKYRKYQMENRNKPLEAGIAMPFIKRFLNINKIYSEERPVEVILLSKNSPETGVRIFNAVKQHNLDISRAAFTSGSSSYKYISAYNISLFLSANKDDVLNAVNSGYGAGRILKTDVSDNDENMELRAAFDFDGVLADDKAEKIYKESELDSFHKYEEEHSREPHNPGPLADFFKKLSYFQKLETKKKINDKNYHKIIKTAIITARSAPAHERAIKTLEEWDVTADEMFFWGGIEKKRILEIFRPHLFFDDQLGHLDESIRDILLVHIPFGIANK